MRGNDRGLKCWEDAENEPREKTLSAEGYR
jgi:hypothetical protein